MSGKMAVVDGVDGAGKGTVMDFISHVLQASHVDFLRTREPGGTPYAERIRELILDRKACGDEPVAAITELLLFWAARAQHMVGVILPALAQDRYVLCDRFVDVTYAYQGTARGLGNAVVAQLEEIVLKGFTASHTLILDVEPKVGLQRVSDRAAKNGVIMNRLDTQPLSFYEQSREVFLDRAAVRASHTVINTTELTIGQTYVKTLLWLEQIGWVSPVNSARLGAASAAVMLRESATPEETRAEFERLYKEQ